MIDEDGARMAAELLQDQSGAGYALAVVGSNNPDQGFWTVERGETWIALATPTETFTKYFSVGGADEFSSNWLMVNSLDFLRSHLPTLNG